MSTREGGSVRPVDPHLDALTNGFLARTPEPPYVAVIFSSLKTEAAHGEAYGLTAARMSELAAGQPGYLGIESVQEGAEITVSYWRTEDDARAWKRVAEHAEAQRTGREHWYSDYMVRIATVTRAYGPDGVPSRAG